MCPSHPAVAEPVFDHGSTIVLENRLKRMEEVLVVERLAQRSAESAQKMAVSWY